MAELQIISDPSAIVMGVDEAEGLENTSTSLSVESSPVSGGVTEDTALAAGAAQQLAGMGATGTPPFTMPPPKQDPAAADTKTISDILAEKKKIGEDKRRYDKLGESGLSQKGDVQSTFLEKLFDEKTASEDRDKAQKALEPVKGALPTLEETLKSKKAALDQANRDLSDSSLPYLVGSPQLSLQVADHAATQRMNFAQEDYDGAKVTYDKMKQEQIKLQGEVNQAVAKYQDAHAKAEAMRQAIDKYVPGNKKLENNLIRTAGVAKTDGQRNNQENFNNVFGKEGAFTNIVGGATSVTDLASKIDSFATAQAQRGQIDSQRLQAQVELMHKVAGERSKAHDDKLAKNSEMFAKTISEFQQLREQRRQPGVQAHAKDSMAGTAPDPGTMMATKESGKNPNERAKEVEEAERLRAIKSKDTG